VPSPELSAVRDLLVQLGRVGPDVPIDVQRSAAVGLGAMDPLPGDVVVEPVDAGGITGEWVRAPDADPARIVLYLHGGGFVIGGPDSHRSFAAHLSRAARARVLLLDYRLAPEHRFPAALDDTTAAYRWLLTLGHDPRRLTIAGDSAGGGLAVAAMVALRDDGVAPPAAGACISPWVDLTCTAASIEARDGRDYLLSGPWLRAMADHYLDGAEPQSTLASPLYADLAGLPPLLVVVGTEEVLYDDALALAERATACGVEVELEVFEDCAHWWMLTGAGVPEAAAAVTRVATFLGARLA
jgi:monoterpene epsilon-lactone hydrolase